MQNAAQIAEAALLETLRTIRIGQTEKEIAAQLLVHLYKHGSDQGLPFAPIVSSGPNTANPHASPSERKLEAGDVLLFDWGAGFEGYYSDITRCFFIEIVDERMLKIAETVQRANHYAVSEGRPGMQAGEIDGIARQEIEESGFGEYFTHRTGHGLGMEAHEAPYIFSGNPLRLKKGMVFTVEPGIYVPGLGGIRIEDDVFVDEDGLTCLTSLPREVMTIERYLRLMRIFEN
jgi:Xaa-Pro dipeptidase